METIEEQLSLDFPLNKTHKKYLKWKNENIDVFLIIKRNVEKMVARGRRFSVDAVVHHVRFNEFFEGYRDDPYRINNNHVAYISRDLLDELPAMRPLVKTRNVALTQEED